MPLKRARKGAGKKAMQNAASYNISELTNANKSKPASQKRSRAQIIAIGLSAARGGKKHK